MNAHDAGSRGTPPAEPCFLSVVVPVYDEEESVHRLHEKIAAACDGLGRPWEVVFVDDGSRDDTYPILRELHERHPNVKVVRFRKNYGQTPAMAAGFAAARGEVIVSMDGDLQNDPADIPRLLEAMDEGYDVVCGWRKRRQDKFVTRRLPSMIANWIIGRLTGVHIHDNGCSLKAYRAPVIKGTVLYSELHRFIPAMATLTGARITEIVVHHHSRRFGTSKYGLGRIWRVVLDIVTVKMITGFVARPAVWFALLSLPALALGAVLLAVGGALYLDDAVPMALTVSTTAFLLVFLGAHLLSLGVVGELVVRTGETLPGKSVLSVVEGPGGEK
jgi:glycosyltransferase involved in cell wall biosynthesis